MESFTASSVGGLLDQVKHIARAWCLRAEDPQELWFRGQPRSDDGLVPTLYRPANIQLYDEASIFDVFKSWGAPYVRRPPRDDWEWYFLGRHHSLPSRLLDWSESVFDAAYFALCERVMRRPRVDVVREADQPITDSTFDGSSPAIWVLDAGTLNRCTLGEDMDRVLIPGGLRSEQYLPEKLAETKNSLNEWPVAVLPPRISERLAAQQGVFTLHGHATESLDRIAANIPSHCSVRLAQITLDSSATSRIWVDLATAGIGRLSVFPDLDGVAGHISWVYQGVR